MATTYRQKLAVVEAIQYTGDNYEEILAFCPEAKYTGATLTLRNLVVPAGNWIQKDASGWFSPCNDTFLSFFEPLQLQE